MMSSSSVEDPKRRRIATVLLFLCRPIRREHYDIASLKSENHRELDSLLARSPRCVLLVWIAILTLGIPPTLQAADKIELRSGITLSGKVVEVSEETLTVEITAGNRTLTRKYPLARVKAITVNGEQRIFDAAVPPKKEASNSSTNNSTLTPDATTTGLIQRTPEEMNALIAQQGRTPPRWFRETTLDFPNTLDLSWPDTKPPTWNYTRHVEHYIWDIINSNHVRYRSGVRFMHHLLQVNRDSPGTLAKIMNELGRMYFEFFDDYARAAFWWQNAKVTENERYARSDSPARLAECYWRLGNRSMAEKLLQQLPLTCGIIKLWGDLQATDRAISLAQEAITQGLEASEVYLLAGDALRTAKRYDEAIAYYEKALKLEGSGANKEQIERNQRRASGAIELIQLFDKLNFADLTDGQYEDKSYGYAGNIHLKTHVRNGMLNEIKITSLSDKQYYHAVDATIKKILRQQTVKGIDAISGATVTSEAVIRATAKAMAQGNQ
ncbi:MAG: hypothetical protein M2R45_05268 [Verrucomicrobia subdivision 3 bacterium]|nr:hypothetical protein [Limisphaerales bacterium]MCS1412687.1 hypothetical protein [Limisphaerales bacterium]